ncbi:cobalamin-binding protein [Deinococcus humi]|uniref:Iron complex transport system substrate-binding protein n=1 Tax=Deinococcus humi TaxID=662880 RepID=A0A7W8JQE9_9DEIO|nr:cobalamin-binding protein [Deinococcus humi]MBB5361282.1 iron complex transport system substrate-binding protein [Deinococcus humi]GGO19292.1 cobalamin-binding protein [Deinococcus humi]
MTTIPDRIISLLPSATDLLFDLGLGARVAGVSHSCDHPGVAGLPILTRSIVDSGASQAEIDRAVSEAVRAGQALYTVDGELLDAIDPGLVVTQGVCEVCAVTPGTIEAAVRFLPGCLPAAQVLSLEGRSFAGILDDLRVLAAAAGVAELGEQLADAAQARWDAIKPVQTAPRVLTLEWVDPPFYGGHWVPEQVIRAGGVNVLGAAGIDSGRTDWAAITVLDPDVIVVMCCGFGLTQNAAFARDLLQRTDLRAVCSGQVWAGDANASFSRPALGVVRGAEVLAELLRGHECAGESVRLSL